MSPRQIEIANKIANGVYTLKQAEKVKSYIWDVFALILKEDKTVLDGYVCCRTCSKLLTYFGKQTSNLCRHKCCLAIKKKSTFDRVTTEDKRNTLEACITMVIEDCCPFAAITCPGFAKLAGFFIKMGATYGSDIDVEDLLSNIEDSDVTET